MSDNKTNAQQYKELVEPFGFDELEIMPGAFSEKTSKALAILYFDARAVMDRLDRVFGFENWWTTEPSFHMIGDKKFCTVGLHVRLADGKEIVRWGESELSDIEAIKGGASGALKRAFSSLGNRTLYEVDCGWQPCETYESGGKKKFSKFTNAGLAAMRKKYDHHFGHESNPGDQPAAEAPDENYEPTFEEEAKGFCQKFKVNKERLQELIGVCGSKESALNLIVNFGRMGGDSYSALLKSAKKHMGVIEE